MVAFSPSHQIVSNSYIDVELSRTGTSGDSASKFMEGGCTYLTYLGIRLIKLLVKDVLDFVPNGLKLC